MSDQKSSGDTPPKANHYELSVGTIAVLQEILPTPQWYKDDPKQGVLVGRAYYANEALPDLPPRPKPEKDEDKDVFEARIKAWADPILEFEWTDKQKDAVKTCVRHYLKQGAFSVTEHTVAMLHMLGLDDE
jgi:hypothetical protein